MENLNWAYAEYICHFLTSGYGISHCFVMVWLNSVFHVYYFRLLTIVARTETITNNAVEILVMEIAEVTKILMRTRATFLENSRPTTSSISHCRISWEVHSSWNFVDSCFCCLSQLPTHLLLMWSGFLCFHKSGKKQLSNKLKRSSKWVITQSNLQTHELVNNSCVVNNPVNM